MGVKEYDKGKDDPLHKSIESLNESELENMEREIAARKNEIHNSVQNYGSVENLSSEDTRILEAQVAAKRRQSMPYKEQIKSWIQNGIPQDEKEIDDVLNHAMESKDILKQYFDGFNGKLSSTLYGLIQEKLPKEKSEPIFENMKKDLNEYVQILYKLKDKGLSFNPEILGYDGLVPLNKEALENIRSRVESRYGKMTLGIPADLTKLYPDAKYQQRDGYAGVVMNKVFDELQGKKVNWEGYIILKEGEKTPGQLYKERRAAERKKFEEERQKQLAQDSAERSKMNIETMDKQNELEVESAGRSL